MSVKHKISYAHNALDVGIAVFVAWIINHFLDGVAKRIRAVFHARNGEAFREFCTRGYKFCFHIIASGLEIHPVEVEFCAARNLQSYGKYRGFIETVKELIHYPLNAKR